MNTKHTPGPWNCNRSSAAGRHIVCSEVTPLDVCVLSQANKSAEEVDANARLIAAAPDLLAALIAFQDGGPQGGQDFAEWHDVYRPAIDLARAAIAKATGSN